MNKMNQRILHAALFMPSPEGGWGLPILGKGKPGTGKTKTVASAARRYGMPYERLSPAERGEGQFGVVPVPGADGFLKYPAPDWVEKFTKVGRGLLFVDEINTAPPALQAPLLGLVQLGTIGSFTMPQGVRIIAAQNDVADAAGGWDLAPALANRFGHFDFEGMDPEDWSTGLLAGFAGVEERPLDPAAEEARVLELWPNAIARARGLVASFITKRPELLHKQPNKASDKNSRAWPSHRTVEYATYALASSYVHNLTEIDTDTFLAGFVGLGWVQEFATWRANMDLPEPADVLDGKVTFKHDHRRLDRSMAVLSACAALVSPEKAKDRDARANKLWGLIGEVAKDAADVAIPAARALRYAQPPLVGTKYPTATQVLSKVWPTLQAAGLSPSSS